MIVQFRRHSVRLFTVLAALLVSLSACGTDKSDSEVIVKAEPPVNGVMEYSPRGLRLFLTELPDVDNSSLRLLGPEGEISLIHLHTMGANDLMAEISQYPLPSGTYTVDWTAQFAGGETEYSGSYKFKVAAPE